MATDPRRELLRHTVATVAYRGGKAVRNAPVGFDEFRAGEGGRTAGEILAHVGDLFEWALSIARGAQVWKDSKPLVWDAECARFFAVLKAFDDYLASGAALHETPEKLFQGPIADGLTHVGQIAMLRRMAGGPMKGENYHQAEIVGGRVGAEQTAPKREF
jgi:hypothetical protein